MKARPLLAAVLCATAAGAWAGPPEIVQGSCARCHGADGVAVVADTPHLDGQLDSYLVDVLGKLQKGRLPTDVPNHIPANLTTDDLAAIAGFYAASKATRPKQETDAEKVARGEIVYRNRCEECHPDNGREGDKDGPRMAAQNLAHLLKQTQLFVSGKRKFGFMQDEAFKGLSRDDLEAASHYFAAQDQVAPKTSRKKRKKTGE